jgi:hypothetical protein
MTTASAKKVEFGKQMVMYKHGQTHIQDILIESLDGVFRTQCQGLTLDEYNEKNGHGFIACTLDDACEEITAIDNSRYLKPFVEITEEIYDEMLECLPPQKWQTVDGVNIFRMMEYLTGNITGHYVSYEGKYYMANRRTTVDYAEIAKEIKSL